MDPLPRSCPVTYMADKELSKIDLTWGSEARRLLVALRC